MKSIFKKILSFSILFSFLTHFPAFCIDLGSSTVTVKGSIQPLTCEWNLSINGVTSGSNNFNGIHNLDFTNIDPDVSGYLNKTDRLGISPGGGNPSCSSVDYTITFIPNSTAHDPNDTVVHLEGSSSPSVGNPSVVINNDATNLTPMRWTDTHNHNAAVGEAYYYVHWISQSKTVPGEYTGSFLIKADIK